MRVADAQRLALITDSNAKSDLLGSQRLLTGPQIHASGVRAAGGCSAAEPEIRQRRKLKKGACWRVASKPPSSDPAIVLGWSAGPGWRCQRWR